ETFIAPVAWQNDWPVINPDKKEIKYTYTFPYPEVKLPDARPQSGNFGYTLTFEKKLDPALLFLRTRDSSSYSLSKDKGLTLKLKPETCAGLGNPSFIGKRQQHLHGSFETELTFASKASNEQAGLVAFQDEQHFYFLCQSVAAGGPVVQLFQSGPDKQPLVLLAQEPLKMAKTKVGLRISQEGDAYRFEFAESPKNWRTLKDKVDARFLSTQVAGGFIGCVVGMYATSSGQPSTNTAAFKYLTLKMGFEVIGGEVAEGRVPPFGIVIGEIVADFQARFGEVAEAAAGE
nr:hypothetical protein [Tanacetum cinerariifolium]